MQYHKLLEKQIKKFLPDSGCQSNPQFANFIQAVNESYKSFERDKELMDHAFSQSEEEYKEIYQNLHREYHLKQKSIRKLYKSLKSLDENIEAIQSEDLEELTEYFAEQISKRKNVEKELGNQLAFQKMLMNIASEYINIPFESIGKEIENSLQELAEFVEADRAYVFKYDFEAGTCSNIYEFCAPNITPQIDELQNVPIEAISEWVEANLAGININIPDVGELDEGNIKDILASQDIKSLLVIPIFLKEKCYGFVGFDSVQNHHAYTETETELLTLFAKVFANAQERFTLENSLTRTVQLLKTLLANLQYGILVEDENRKIEFTNEMFCEMFHIPVPPESLVGADCSNSAEESKHLFTKEEEFQERIEQILHEKKMVVNELLQTKDGKYLERDYIPIYIDDQYRGHLWKYNDITIRITNQKLLEQSEERNRLIMSSAINAIVTANHKGEVIYWNKMAEQIFGWTKDEIFGKTLAETIVPLTARKEHAEGLKNYTDSRESKMLNRQFETIANRKSGEEFPIELSIIPLEQENEKFFTAFIQDISVRKRAEENLKVQEEKYRNIIANMNLGILEVDANEVIQYANQSFCDVSGYELDELLGRTPEDLFVINSPKNRELVNKHLELRKIGHSSQFRIPVKNKRGELRWWVVSGAPNYDDKGNLVGSIGIHLDITEQKKLEEDLKKEKEKAQEASKAKEAFLANMSHEIRTPLNAIIGFLRELRKQELTLIQTQFVENSCNASQHLLSIINNVLDISKIEAGEMSLEIKDFSLIDSVNNVVNILQPKAVNKKISLRTEISQEVEEAFRGDQLKIEQILFNLIGNSLKFTHKGTIIIRCEVMEDKPKKQKIKISVVDSGIGMSKDFVTKIFKKFYQEDETIARKFGGTGLGMAITNELVKLMHGKITIESEKNKGTTIEVTLSLSKGERERFVTRDQFFDTNSVADAKILLVEDNDLNRMVAQNTLINFNCQVTEAENGTQALKILDKEKFDMILMDIQMPELDGIQTTEIIRKKYKLDTPIIAFTANAFKTEIEKCFAVGMNDYVVKPFTEEVLLSTLYKNLKTKNHFGGLQFDAEIESLPTQNLYNLTSIRQLSRGNEDFVKKMITIFIEQTESTIPKIHTHFEINDYEEISRLLHKIKPSIEGLGIHSISEEVRHLEAKAKEESLSHAEMKELFVEIEKTLKEVVQLLKDNEL